MFDSLLEMEAVVVLSKRKIKYKQWIQFFFSYEIIKLVVLLSVRDYWSHNVSMEKLTPQSRSTNLNVWLLISLQPYIFFNSNYPLFKFWSFWIQMLMEISIKRNTISGRKHIPPLTLIELNIIISILVVEKVVVVVEICS